MENRVRNTAAAAVALTLGALLAADAGAAVCGDADGNGNVTVSDGVQVLRSAAGLSSTCAAQPGSCDIDGSGTVTVSDGVNVLRKAAGLTVAENCPDQGDGAADLAQITDVLVPFLSLALREVPNVSIASTTAAHPAGTEDCEDGGSRTTSYAGFEATVTFAACRVSEPGIGSFQFDGSIRASASLAGLSVDFALVVTDRASNRVVEFDGALNGTPRPGGGFVIDDGPVAIRSGHGGAEIFRITCDHLTVDGDNRLLSGSITAEDTSDSFALATAEIVVEGGSSTAAVHVVGDDHSERDYRLDLATGELTPLG